MKTKELLLECKVKLKTSTDYGLAKALDIPRQRISDYMNNNGKADEFACFKIAECLGRDPSQIIAEVNAESDTKQGAYFRDFLRRQSLPVLAALLVSTSCATYTREASAATYASADTPRIMRRKVKRRKHPEKSLTPTKTASGPFFYVP